MLSRLSSLITPPSGVWTQISKTSSGTANTPLPLAAAMAAPVTVTSITSSGTTATVTTAAAHNLQTGDRATIAGCSNANYNGTFVVTVTGSTTFTYTMANTATSPATGTTLEALHYYATTYPAKVAGFPVVSITSSSGVATVTTSPAHGLVVGQVINVRGSAINDYNGVFNVKTVPSSTTFTYAVNSGIASPATPVVAPITFAVPQTLVTRAILRAASGNAAVLNIGPDSTASFDTIAAGADYLLDGDGGETFDLASWYFASASASQSLLISFLN